VGEKKIKTEDESVRRGDGKINEAEKKMKKDKEVKNEV
jgi:hypothetical protein